jgi:hypothetical protein
MNRSRSLFFKILVHVFLPLLIGLFIYVLYRPNVWITRYLNSGIDTQSNTENHSLIEKWLIFSGPDFCWAYSFASLVFILNHSFKFMSHAAVFIFVLLLTEASEMLQLLLKPNFTFSISDMIAILIACSSSFFLNKKP